MCKISIFCELSFWWLSNEVLWGIGQSLSDMNPCLLFFGFLTEDCLILHCVCRVCQCFHINPTAWHPLTASANYLCHSDKYCFTVSSPAAGDPQFIPNSQLCNKTRFMVNLSGTAKSQISCKYPPTEVSESLAPLTFKERTPSLPEKLEARQLAAAGCSLEEVARGWSLQEKPFQSFVWC